MSANTDKPNAAELARVIGCHRSYMHRVLAGDRSLNIKQAVKIFNAKAVKIGPIANLSDAEIRALERMGDRLSA